jgi:hypothetical protein
LSPVLGLLIWAGQRPRAPHTAGKTGRLAVVGLCLNLIIAALALGGRL